MRIGGGSKHRIPKQDSVGALLSLIPEITDQDIEWAQRLLDLQCIDEYRRDFLKRKATVDLSACPGSGKTTLIVAKLAILARKWPHRTKGICVLSHTNVARDQIERRLGHTVAGQKLLAYPHYIGTIHGFVNRFLSLPWLYSNGYPTPIIDDEVASNVRRSVLDKKDYYSVQSYLKKKHCTFEELRISARDLSFDLDGKQFPAGPTTNSYRYAAHAIRVSAERGYFRHDEMFVWARALIDDHGEIRYWLTQRFPLLILDEVQDTSDDQESLLDDIFSKCSNLCVVQKVGDPNQAIFDIVGSHRSRVSSFPSADRVLEIPNSFRFGREIARLASPFGVRPVGATGLEGVGPSGARGAGRQCKNAILVFPDNNTAGVLDVFGRHVLDVLGGAPQEGEVVAAVGHIHHDDPDVKPGHAHYPRAVGDYWEDYSPVAASIDYNPNSLALYVRAAQTVSPRTAGEVSLGLQKIAYAVLRLAQGIGNVGDLRRKGRGHRLVVDQLATQGGVADAYMEFVMHFLVERASLSREEWPIYANMFGEAAAALCIGEVDLNRARQFLAWPKEWVEMSQIVGSSVTEAGPNLFRVVDRSRTVDIRLGSIHSVKGQTHLATLLLSTYWHGHSSGYMMDWLVGERVNGGATGVRNLQRLRQSYVAMTRPSHLLCVAVPRSSLCQVGTMTERIVVLKHRGWHVAEITNGSTHWWT